MKFTLSDQFELTVNDTQIKGEYKKLTKKQEAEFKKKFKKEFDLTEELIGISKKLRRLEIENKINKEEDNTKLLELSDRLEEIQTTLEKSEAKEKLAKERFSLSIDSAQLEELIELGENYGYSLVIEMINEAVAEGKQKEPKS